MWSHTLRLKITGRDGVQKFDAIIPAGFLEGMTKIIPDLYHYSMEGHEHVNAGVIVSYDYDLTLPT
uniref:Uncharacterized protein n=1 Tax=Arundo donax TaxID=35708 RepID=A0A0A9FAG0_ARUDO